MKIVGIRNTENRHYCYIEVLGEKKPDGDNKLLGKNEKRGILGEIIDAHMPLIPTKGGVGESNFIIITPQNEYFYACDYSKDLEGWRQQIEKGATILDVRIATIVDEKYLVLSDGTKYSLADCKFERYNFYYKNAKGQKQLQKERERIDKKDLFPNDCISKQSHKSKA